MDEITKQFRLKEDSIKPLDVYLGVNISKRHLDDKENLRAMGSHKYLKAVTKAVEYNMKNQGVMFTYKANQPFSSTTYHPEINISSLYYRIQTQFFQTLFWYFKMNG